MGLQGRKAGMWLKGKGDFIFGTCDRGFRAGLKMPAEGMSREPLVEGLKGEWRNDGHR